MALSDIVRKLDNTINGVGTRRAAQAGWRPAVTGYYGYGDADRIRVLARVLMHNPEPPKAEVQRGFRQFFTLQVGDAAVTIHAGEQTVHTRTNHDGYIDVPISNHGLAPGWQRVRIDVEGGESAEAEVLVLERGVKYGLVSDVDDTVMVTMLPRAMIAAYNSWFLKTNARKPVPGMAELYACLREKYGQHMPVFYLSTGAWNTFPSLASFLARHGFPKGPLLLTDWGPTQTGLFRSGQEHKKVQLRNLIIDFPDIHWILVGDDGQHDPLTYGNLAMEHPGRVERVAIRELTPGEHLLAHGTAVPIETADGRGQLEWVTGADGYELAKQWPEVEH
ncbi:phosphatase domain-containing protein [Corynebacterium sp. H128]|uniref:App1 family protein n=1 Tax=unclassified Corynebacterium TaxID=2624378 RepID=UPI0030B60E1C